MQYFHDPHMFNVFTTAHGLIMIFFMVMPAIDRRVRQLVRRADDRSARTCVPTHEQYLVLAVPASFALLIISMFVEGERGEPRQSRRLDLYAPPVSYRHSRPGQSIRDLSLHLEF